MEYYLAIKKYEILPFVTVCMDLEGIMLGEISQTETNTIWFHFYVESKMQSHISFWFWLPCLPLSLIRSWCDYTMHNQIIQDARPLSRSLIKHLWKVPFAM